MPITFGRVELDFDIELHDLTDINTAWVDSGPRDIIGIFRHGMVGTLAGTTRYFATDARHTALTDCGIGGPWDGKLDGVMHQYIPKGSRCSPHASGPASHVEGDGVAFIRVMGVSAVNRNMFSVERSDGGNQNAPFSQTATPKQWHSIAQIIAYKFDQAEVPWDTFPKHPKYGITTFLDHWEIGPKDCPFAAMRAETNRQIDHIRGILKAAQTGVGTQAPVKVTPVKADPDAVKVLVPYSTKDDIEFLTRRFGSAVKIKADGTTELGADGKPRQYRFDPKGTVSNAWINRSLENKAFPSIERIIESDEGGRLTTYFEFRSGETMVDVSDDKRGFFWAGSDDE